MNSVPIGALIERVQSWSPAREPERNFAYIDLGSVDNSRKVITGATLVLGAEAPSRARQIVATGDILVSTVRPNLNAVAVVPPSLDGATASTGFTVLRPSPKVDGRYLFHWVRSREFVCDMVRRATGASYPAVSDRIVKDSIVPTPHLSEQRRIAAILDRADAIRTKRRQVLAHLKSLAHSTFHEMFGAPSSWADRGPMTTIGELARSIDYGTAAKAGASGEWPILRMGNLTDEGRINLSDLKYLDLSPAEVPKYTTCPGDMLFNRTNSKEKVGKAAVVRTQQPFALAGYLIRVRFENAAIAEFVAAYLRSTHGRAVRLSRAKAAVNQANISASEMRKIGLTLPPTFKVELFAERIAKIEAFRATFLHALQTDEELFASLQSRAFRGEL